MVNEKQQLMKRSCREISLRDFFVFALGVAFEEAPLNEDGAGLYLSTQEVRTAFCAMSNATCPYFCRGQ
jgi:hypothetical protein